MTVDEFARPLALELGEQPEDIDTLVTFRRWTAEGVQDMFLTKNWPFTNTIDTITTADATANYTLDADVADIRALFRTDIDDYLSPTTVDYLRRENFDYDAPGEPDRWYISQLSAGKTVIGLWKVPTSEIEILVYGNSRVLETFGQLGTETLPLPAEGLIALAHYVRSMYWDHAGDDTRGTKFDQRYGFSLGKLIRRWKQSPRFRHRFAYRDVPRAHSVGPVMPTSIPEADIHA